MLELKNISKIYSLRARHIEAVKNLNLSIREGELVAIVGPSGCGKTTVLKMIAGLLAPTDGEVLLDGKKVEGPGIEMGWVPQDYTLFPWLTVRENIAFGLRFRADKTSQEKTELVQHFINVTGLRQFAESYPAELSGGMKQRVAIARTFANDPKLIALDEPFGSLDSQTRSQLQDFLLGLWQEEKKTIILVTHDLEEAIYMADRIIVLTTQPGTAKEILEINLPRPRTHVLRYEHEFGKLRKYLYYQVRSEVIKASWTSPQDSSAGYPRLGLHAWLGDLPFYLAKEMRLLEKYRIPVEFLNLEKREDRTGLWLKGDLEFLNVTLDVAILLREKKPELKILMPMSQSIGAEALIARNEIATLNDLRGKRIAIEKDWLSYFFLLYVLDSAGISPHEVELVDMDVSKTGSALLAGEIDAGVLWEPWLAKTLELGTLHTLADSKKHPVIYDVLIATESVLKKYPTYATGLRSAWRDSVEMFEKNKIDSIRKTSYYTGTSPEEVALQLGQIRFLDNTNTQEMSDMISKVQDVFIKAGVLHRKIRPDELIFKE